MPTGLGIDSIGEERELGPSRRIVRRDGGDSGDREIDAEREAEFLALEPARQGSRDGHDLRFSTKSNNGAACDHEIEVALKGRQQSAQENENREEQQRLLDPEAIDEDAADQQRRHCRHAVAGIEPSEHGSGVIQLLEEYPLQRIDAVVNVVITEHGQADKDQHQPAVRLARLRTGIDQRLRYGHSSGLGT